MEINKLAQCILEYESDTFSTDSADITPKELNMILDKIYTYIINHELDGAWLTNMLEEIREDAKESKDGGEKNGK